MSRLLSPVLLTLGVAFPTATLALGLGDLHVESALHQPLVAHIELVDARHEDLVSLRAAIADEDTFQRYALDRPIFLNGMTVKVGQDAQGQPILLLRSTESITEPAVTVLVDVHWPNGELIREYTVLLDPPERILETPAAVAVSSVAASAESPARAASARPVQAAVTTAASSVDSPAPTATPDPESQVRSYTTSRRDTLARVAIKAGAHSRIARHKMMIAIYRINPAAFQAGPNSLHRGVVLRLPTAQDLSAISSAEAEREYRVQAAAWRATDPRALRAIKRRATAASALTVTNSPVNAKPKTAKPGSVKADTTTALELERSATLEADRAALTNRVESLEKSLQAMRAELQQTQSQQQALTRLAAAPATASVPTASSTSEPSASSSTADDDEPVPQLFSRLPFYRRAPILTAIAGLALAAAVGALLMRRRRRDDEDSSADETSPMSVLATPHRAPAAVVSRESARAPVAAVETPLAAEPTTGQTTTALPSLPPAPESLVSGRFPELFNTPIEELLAREGLLESACPVDTGETTAILTQQIEGPGNTVEHKFSFYNPESHNDTTHVVMGSELHHSATSFVERRKNPATVLQQAIEREPNRSDLHLKLLELYYAAAAENQRAFLDAARQITQNNKLMSAEDLARISEMGRKIAPDDELFSSDLDDQAVA
ncbi:MAG TPA: FimV/HubP family polar landmark protein [Steroidobacteraceae bacterium]|jgi:pilus assembly protein FimV